MPSTKSYFLVSVLLLFVSLGIGQDVINNFGTSRILVQVKGKLYIDSAWTKPLSKVDIKVELLTNASERYIKGPGNKPMINPDFEPEYQLVGMELRSHLPIMQSISPREIPYISSVMDIPISLVVSVARSIKAAILSVSSPNLLSPPSKNRNRN